MIRRRTLILYCLAVALLTGAFAVWQTYKPQAQAGGKTITVNIDHLEGDDTTCTIRTEEEYLRGALEQEGLIDGTEGEYGLYVLTVDGETADYAADGAYWSLSENGEYLMTGAGQTILTDGATYEITYTVYGG